MADPISVTNPTSTAVQGNAWVLQNLNYGGGSALTLIQSRFEKATGYIQPGTATPPNQRIVTDPTFVAAVKSFVDQFLAARGITGFRAVVITGRPVPNAVKLSVRVIADTVVVIPDVDAEAGNDATFASLVSGFAAAYAAFNGEVV